MGRPKATLNRVDCCWAMVLVVGYSLVLWGMAYFLFYQNAPSLEGWFRSGLWATLCVSTYAALRLWLRLRLRASTLYAVTSHGLTALSDMWVKRVRSTSLLAVDEVSVMPHARGMGTVYVGAHPLLFLLQQKPLQSLRARSESPSLVFFNLANAEQVAQIIRKQATKLRTQSDG